MMAYTPDEFAAVLIDAAAKAPGETTKVVRAGSFNVKRDGRRNVLQTAPRRNAHAHLAIDFDVDVAGPLVEGEIGYDKNRPGGALGNLLEFGGGGDHSPAHRDLARALEDEEPRFERALADMGERLLD